MDINLFANLEEINETTEKENSANHYNQMLEQRVRPVAPEIKDVKPALTEKKMEEQLFAATEEVEIKKRRKPQVIFT